MVPPYHAAKWAARNPPGRRAARPPWATPQAKSAAMSLPPAHSEAWRCWNMVPQWLSGADASAEQVAGHNRHARTEATIVRFERVIGNAFHAHG